MAVIDFHAHVLPEMDHGCEDVSMALRQLKAAKDAGIDIVIATSHFYPQSESIQSFLSRREEAVRELKREIEKDKENRYPEVIPAAEVLLCDGMEHMEELSCLCIDGTAMLLLEMPFSEWSERTIDTLERLENRKDLDIVLAHVERYSAEQQDHILEMGYEVQVNSSFVRRFGARRSVRRFLKAEQVVALGSDIHGCKNGYRYFGKAYRFLVKNLVDFKEVKGKV